MVKNSIKIYARLKQEYQAKTAPYETCKTDKDEIITFRFCQVGTEKNQKSSHTSRHRKFFETKSSESFFKNYRFEQIFDQNSTQTEVFDVIAKPVVHSVIEGFNGTIFAYGQTGSGKTYAITGSSQDYLERGLIPRSIEEIFSYINKAPEKYTIYISFLEIYNEIGYDLLNPKSQLLHLEELRVILLEDGKGKSHLRNLTVQRVSSEQEAMRLLLLGDANRTITETPMNVYSSRSHCIFTISVHSRITSSGKLRRSKLNLVDLAGSERICKSDISGTTLNEAKYINLSLHYLEQVILALSQKKPHIPFRNSMLTYVLKDSLSGNCKTVLLATLSLNRKNIEETLATCKFAQRVAEVSMDATIADEVDPLQEIDCLKSEIEELRKQLLQQSKFKISGSLTKEEKQQWKNIINKYLDDVKDEIPFTTFDMRLIKYSFKLLKAAVKSKSEQKTKLKSTEQGNKELIQQFKDVIKQKEDEIFTLKSLLCSNVSSQPKGSTSFSCSDSDDSSLHSYVEQEKENIPPNSDSFTLSPGQKVAFEVFMKDSKNTSELDYYKQAIQEMFTIAKKITLVVEQCQNRIAAVRKKQSPESVSESIEFELQKHQNRYKNSLKKLHDLKSKTEVLKKGLEKAKMKIWIKFRQWYDSLSNDDNISEDVKNTASKNKFSTPPSNDDDNKSIPLFEKKPYKDVDQSCSSKKKEIPERPKSPTYKYQNRWRQRDQSPCSTISTRSGTEGDESCISDECKRPSSRPKTPSRIPRFNKIHKNSNPKENNSIEIETVFEDKNRPKPLFTSTNYDFDGSNNNFPTISKEKEQNSNTDADNGLIAPPNSETKNSENFREKIVNNSLYNSKLNVFYEANGKNILSSELSTPICKVEEPKIENDNISDLSKDYSLWEEGFKKQFDFKDFIGKVRSPYKVYKQPLEKNTTPPPRPKTANNFGKRGGSLYNNILQGPRRPEHLKHSSSFDPEAKTSSARSARSDNRKFDTFYNMIMGYDTVHNTVDQIESMRPFSADSPFYIHGKYNPKHRIGVSHLQHNSRYPITPSHRYRSLRFRDYNAEEDCKFSEEQETLESVYDNRRPKTPYYSSSFQNNPPNTFGLKKHISPQRERLFKEDKYSSRTTTLNQKQDDYQYSYQNDNRPNSPFGTHHRVLRPGSAGKQAYYSKLFFPDDSLEFRRFIGTIPLTGDIDVDEEIVKFYRTKFV